MNAKSKYKEMAQKIHKLDVTSRKGVLTEEQEQNALAELVKVLKAQDDGKRYDADKFFGVA